MKIRSAALEKVVGITSEIPVNPVFEVAFAGRSNVGKSSLINTLLCRKRLAHTSEKPGKTQTVNYYRVNAGSTDAPEKGFAPDCYLVDLPGYGYAAMALSEKRKWGAMIEKYLTASRTLRTVFLLVDIRHTPSENDILMHDWIKANGMEPVIIATKKDKIKRSQLSSSLRRIRETLRVREDTPVVPFSAMTRQGRDEVWRLIARP